MLPLLDARGILHTGAGLDADAAQSPAVGTAGGVSLGVVAFSDNEPGWEATQASPGIFFVPTGLGDRRVHTLLDLVGQTRERLGGSGAGFLVVSAHWGPNWGTAVPDDHRALAHALVDAGADVVFGHDRRVLRPSGGRSRSGAHRRADAAAQR